GERHLEDFAVVVGSARGGGSVQVSIWSLDETTDGITAVGAIEIVNDLDGASWRRHAKNDALAIGSTTGSAIEIAVRGQQQRRTHTCGRIQLQLLVGSGGNGDGVSCARIGDAVQIAVFPLYGRAFGNSFTFRETVQHSDRAGRTEAIYGPVIKASAVLCGAVIVPVGSQGQCGEDVVSRDPVKGPQIGISAAGGQLEDCAKIVEAAKKSGTVQVSVGALRQLPMIG